MGGSVKIIGEQEIPRHEKGAVFLLMGFKAFQNPPNGLCIIGVFSNEQEAQDSLECLDKERQWNGLFVVSTLKAVWYGNI